MVVERLDICEDAHGVRFVAHLQHVVHLDEPEAVGLLPETHGSEVSAADPRRPGFCGSYSAVEKASSRFCLR